MLKTIKEYRFYITLVIFILIPILTLDTTNRKPSEYHVFDRALLSVMTPVQNGLSFVMDQSVRLFHRYFFLIQVSQDNQTLTLENQKLLSEIAHLTEFKLENDRLRKILDYQEEYQLETIIARVIAKDVSSDFRSIRINRGSNHGVVKGMPVVTHEGIIGRVLRTTGNTADILTLFDPLSSIDTVDERSRVHGIVEGVSEDTCQLKFIQRTDDIRVGDRLISSGLGQVFPRGVPVGVVTRVHQLAYGITQEVEVKPTVPFSKLEEVIVIKKQQPENAK